MSDEEFEEEAELDEEELDDDDDLEVEVLDDADDVVVDEVDLLDDDPEEESPAVPVPVGTDAVVGGTAEEEADEEGVVDLDGELPPDDVEAPLDTLLQERTASATLEADEEDLGGEEGHGDAREDGPARVVPRPPDEFLCQSSFLLLPLRRLADPA